MAKEVAMWLGVVQQAVRTLGDSNIPIHSTDRGMIGIDTAIDHGDLYTFPVTITASPVQSDSIQRLNRFEGSQSIDVEWRTVGRSKRLHCSSTVRSFPGATAFWSPRKRATPVNTSKARRRPPSCCPMS